MVNRVIYQITVRVREGNFTRCTDLVLANRNPQDTVTFEDPKYDSNQKSYEFTLSAKSRTEKDRILNNLLSCDDILYGCKPMIASR